MEQFYNAIDLLKGMIAIPSISREESEVADYLFAAWQAEGHKVYRKGNNLWMITPNYDETKKTLLLNAHIDTVKPTDNWTADPFTPILSDDGERLYGLGSNDDGASLVSLYTTYTTLASTPQAYNLIFVASAEEEISGRQGIECVLPELPPISFAVVGEPTGMQPAIAEKGLMVIDCKSIGKSGHAARNEGVNAIMEAMKDIAWFDKHRFPLKSELLGEVKMSVTIIHAGTQHNVVPATCDFTVDIRSNELYTNEALFEQIKESVSCEVKARSFRLNSSSIPSSHPFVQRAILMGKTPFGSPTMSDQALMPFPTVKIGPGDSARSHTADEYIRLSEIQEAIALYVRLLDRLIF